MIAEGWQLSCKAVALSGATVAEVEADAVRKNCSAFRVAVDGGVEVFRRIAGEWVCTFSGRP